MKSGLYTRSGDTGMTSLVGGDRVKKNSVRLEAYGTIDELSSALGMVASDTNTPQDLREDLHRIQNELFNIGCYLATDVKAGEESQCRSLADGMEIEQMEKWIDILDAATPKINKFVLPGGCERSAKSHMARVICRRAERRVLDLAEESYVDPMILSYLNRMSDYLFILARNFNQDAGMPEITWIPKF